MSLRGGCILICRISKLPFFSSCSVKIKTLFAWDSFCHNYFKGNGEEWNCIALCQIVSTESYIQNGTVFIRVSCQCWKIKSNSLHDLRWDFFLLIGNPSLTLAREYRMMLSLTWPQRTAWKRDGQTDRKSQGQAKWPGGICAAVKPRRAVNKQAGCCCRINPGLEHSFTPNWHVD